MMREQMLNFLQAAVVFLLIINAFTIAAAVCAMRLASGLTLGKHGATGTMQRRLDAVLAHVPARRMPVRR